MNKYKVCVYAICKNEDAFVDRWMDSMSEADLIVVTDTGSTDKTVEKLRERGAVVFVDEVKPWRFDVARNKSLAHVPDDVDICVCTDLDEIFVKGWREHLEKAWRPEASMGRYLYNWSLKPDGSPDVQLNYFKIHKKHDYTWICPIHEYLGYIGKGQEIKVFIDNMVLNHYPDDTKSRGSYLPLLELAAQETPESDRVLYYLGREYMFSGQWQKSIDTLKKHLTLKSATWEDERCASMRWIAKCNYNLGNKSEAYRWYYRAIAEVPTMRDPYVECAQIAYSLEDWTMCYFMAQEALRITQKSSTYANMGYAWDSTPSDLAAISSYRLGMYEKSLEYAKAALALAPNDERLKNNLNLIELKVNEMNRKADL